MLNKWSGLRPGEIVHRELVYVRAKFNSAWIKDNQFPKAADKTTTRGRKQRTDMDAEETRSCQKCSRSYRDPS